MAALQASSTLAPQADASPSETTDGPSTSNAAASTDASTSGVSAVANNNTPVLQAAQPGTQAQPGPVLDALNTQPAFADELQAAQVSTEPAGTPTLPQMALTDEIEGQDPAADLVAFFEGEAPDGQKQGVILDAKATSPDEMVQQADPPVTDETAPAAGAAVPPGKPVVQPLEEIGAKTAGAVAVKEAQPDNAVRPVEKPAAAQEAGIPAVEVNHVSVQMPEIQPKQGLTQAALAQQVTNGMEMMIRQGRSSMHIQLSPLELGGISIHLVSGSQGVSVTVTADQAGTGHMLQAQADQLRQALSDAGVNIANLNVGQQQLSGQFKQDRESYAEAKLNRFHNPRELAVEETQPMMSAYQTGGGSVDYRV